MQKDDVIYKQAAIKAVSSLCDDCDSGHCGSCHVKYPGEKDAVKVLKELPPVQPKLQPTCKQLATDTISRQQALNATRGRIFQEIVVAYPSYYTYPEHKGKPYFSIKYTENGQEFIGYGTYKPEVLSEYLKEYFMPSAQPEPNEGHWIPHETPDGGEQYECSRCGVLWEFNYGTPEDNEAYFCPKCGTKMKGADI